MRIPSAPERTIAPYVPLAALVVVAFGGGTSRVRSSAGTARPSASSNAPRSTRSRRAGPRGPGNSRPIARVHA